MKSEKSRDACHAQELLHRALGYEESGQLEKAIDCSTKSLKLDPTVGRAWNCIGVCHNKQGDDTKAIECYMRALEVDPRLLRPWINLANRYRSRGAHRAALFCYAEATALTPTEPEEWAMKAEAFRALKQEAEARQCVSKAVECMTRLLESDIPVPQRACAYFLSVLSPMIPIIPRPIIEAVAESAEPALCRIFEHGQRYSSSRLMSSAGVLLYRWYEAHADYASARKILDVLLNAATAERDEPEIAQLTNNYGYEYLLESQFTRAEPYFTRSLALFERLGSFTEINNSRANLLTCRFGMLAADRWDELLPELKQVNHAFSSLGHWHARKTLILLARRAEHRGNRPAAIKWAQRAVKASGERPTHHRLEDLSYLHFLENQSSEHWRRQSPPASADRRNTQIRSEAPG